MSDSLCLIFVNLINMLDFIITKNLHFTLNHLDNTCYRMARTKDSGPKKVMSSNERSTKRRLDPMKREADNLKRREARRLKTLENPLSLEELKDKREKDRLRKAMSRLSQYRQKKVGTKLKDRNRKRAQKEIITPTSTERVQKYRENLVKFDFTSKKRRVDNASSTIKQKLSALSPMSKKKAVTKVCNDMSPLSRQAVANGIQGQDPLLNFTSTISKKRDKNSNCTRQLVLSNVVKRAGSWQEARKFNRQLSWTSLVKASEKDIDQLINHYKTVPMKTKKPPTETMRKVFEFYDRDEISRQLPYKNMTRKIKDHLGVYHRVPMRVMEVTLRNSYMQFKEENPTVKIGRRTFEQLRPKHIRLRRFAQRLQCCCTYHTNINYLRRAVNNIYQKNKQQPPFGDNDALMSSSLCSPNSIRCIMRICNECKTFSKIDELGITLMKCSKECFNKENDCSNHTVLVKQFERVTYMYKGKEKKKLKLQDKMMKLTELIALLKLQMQKFPMHRFNVKHTAETFENLINNLDDTRILKIHYFSENYTCLLPEEIHSLHWVQETATVYPIVVMRKVEDDVREDHLVFISDDKKHDVPFVEKCNEILHNYYVENGNSIKHDIEYNDGCASQFKCIRAFSSLARRPVKTTRIFCETSHGKSKSDGL